MATPERIAPYILAGGRSSRMGRDKAMISFGGKTLLARAVDTLRSAASLGSSREGTRVTVIGERTLLEGADRSICDRYPGCGPLGGMEAALSDLESDLESGLAHTQAAEWAFFLPIDMPFLSVRLIDSLLPEWIAAAQRGARVCHVVVDDRPQPLVSMVHREVRPFLVNALNSGEFRVTPVLHSACRAVASDKAGALGLRGPALWQTIFPSDPLCSADKASHQRWFANLNTEQDLREAETFL